MTLGSRESLLRQAVDAFEAGDRTTAEELLAEVLQRDPVNEPAWLWMARVVEPEGQRRECWQQVLHINPNNAEARRRLEEMERLAAGPQPAPISLGPPHCEKCGRPLGVELLACPERVRGACLYRVEQTSQTRSAFVRLADRDTLYNPDTGQMWERLRFVGTQWSEVTASAFQPLPGPGQPLDGMRYPASVNALYRLNDVRRRGLAEWIEIGTDLFYAALLNLLSWDLIRLQHTTVNWSQSAAVERYFVLTVGGGQEQLRTMGELEQRLVNTVLHWAGRLDSSLTFEGASNSRVFYRRLRHCLTLDDALTCILGGNRANPGKWLVDQIAGPDALHRGVGARKGFLFKKLRLSSQERQFLHDDHQIVARAMEAFAAAQPDLAADLQGRIRKALEDRIFTGD